MSPSTSSLVSRMVPPVALLAVLVLGTGLFPWQRRHVRVLCEVATEMSEDPQALVKDFGPGDAAEARETNFERVLDRYTSVRRPGKVRERIEALADLPFDERREAYEAQLR